MVSGRFTTASGRLIGLRCLCAIFLATLGSCAYAASATAATRYASPDGTGPASSCPQTDPCSLEDAIEAPAVATGDSVVVATGVYLLTSPLDIGKGISAGGAPSALPTIVATTPGQPAIAVDAPGAELHDVTLVQVSGEPAIRVRHGVADRVSAESDGAVACELGVTGGGESVIRDSVCWSGPAATPAASAVSVAQAGAGARAGTLRNVTAWASGSGGSGIGVSAAGGGEATIDARNVIASGAGGDVDAAAAAASAATVTLATSNFEGVTTGGAGTTDVTPASSAGNQTADPDLVDPDAGSFDEVAGSPTIDAGSVGSLLGDREIGGEPRIQGPAPDIGADERDGAPPRTTIDSGPAAAVRTGKVTFAFHSDEPGSTFSCQIDDADPKRCTSPHTTDTLEQGDHVFRVWATDPAGNVEPTPAERLFTVDKVIDGANAAARRNQRVRGSRVQIFVTVRSAELTRARAAGTLRVTKRSFRIESSQRTLVAGGGGRLVLRPKDGRQGRRIARALRKGKPGEAEIEVTFVDLLGNSATSGVVEVRLKPRRGK